MRQPHVVTLLASKGSQKSNNGNSNDNNNSDETSSDSSSGIRIELVASGSISVTNLAFILGRVGKQLKNARHFLFSIANHNVAISQISPSELRSGSAVESVVVTSKERRTFVSGARIAVVADNGSVDTSFDFVASVSSANTVIVAIFARDHRSVDTSINWV